MKGEPGRPAGAGWAGGSGGRGGGRAGGGVGAPARTHVLPGARRRGPARAFWATAAAPPEPGHGIGLPPIGGKGARGGYPCAAPSGSCQSPGSAWHPAGLPKESLPGVAALREGRGGSAEFRGSRGRPRPVPRARTPDNSGLGRGGAAAGQGRACVRSRCHPRGLVSAPGLAPSPCGPERLSGHRPGKCRRSALCPALCPAAATSESARAGARRAPRACQDALGGPGSSGAPPLDTLAGGWRWGGTRQPTGSAGRGGG